jgi:parallel beta-helix repeat protein
MKLRNRKTHIALHISLLLLILLMFPALGPVNVIENASSIITNDQITNIDLIHYDIKLDEYNNTTSIENFTPRFFPIYIKGNNALKGFWGRLHGVVKGQGTEDDPYVIAGWEPQWRKLWKYFNRYDAIHLENIDKHVLIKNNYIHGWDLYDPRYPSGTGISIRHCNNITIEYNLIAKNTIGLAIWSSHCIIQFNTITENAAGVVCAKTYAYVMNNSIFYNTDCGIISNDGHATITCNDIYSNGEHGVRCGGADRSHIKNNVIYDNYLCGIYFGDYDIGGTNPIISYNVIHLNKRCGIRCVGFTESVIQNNSIFSNKEGGIECYKSNPTITDNIVTSNGGIGINICYDDGISPSMISHNNISFHKTGIHCAFSNWIIIHNIISEHSNTGIDVGNSQPHIQYNNFANNHYYAVYNSGWQGRRTNATWNWWGAPDGPSGNGTGSGDPISSWVDYIPWLYEPNPFAGPR